jgi:hypothetical protein
VSAQRKGRPLRAPQMAWQTLDDELVLHNTDGKELLGVNAVGARIWDLADGTRSIDEIAAVIVAEFAVDAATAHADVRAYLDALAAAGAITY